MNLKKDSKQQSQQNSEMSQKQLQESIRMKLSTRIAEQMNDSDEDIDALPSWMRDVQPYVASKFDKVFNIYKTWQET